MDFHFAELNTTVALRATSRKISKDINIAFQAFVAPLNKKDGVVEATDAKAADFLSQQVYKLLKDVYKVEQLPDYDAFDDAVSLSEVYGFMIAQVDTNGTADFLLQPIGALLKGFETVVKELNTRVESETKKMMDSITPGG